MLLVTCTLVAASFDVHASDTASQNDFVNLSLGAFFWTAAFFFGQGGAAICAYEYTAGRAKDGETPHIRAEDLEA
jgi:hypothetical protein